MEIFIRSQSGNREDFAQACMKCARRARSNRNSTKLLSRGGAHASLTRRNTKFGSELRQFLPPNLGNTNLTRFPYYWKLSKSSKKIVSDRVTAVNTRLWNGATHPPMMRVILTEWMPAALTLVIALEPDEVNAGVVAVSTRWYCASDALRSMPSKQPLLNAGVSTATESVVYFPFPPFFVQLIRKEIVRFTR